jgi:hypothetical protein
MAESLLALFLIPDFWIALAIRSVIAGLILFVTSRLVGAKGGLLSAMGVAFLTTVVTIFVFETYVFPLLVTDSGDILTAITTNLLGLALTYILPGVVWFFLSMILLKVGPLQALAIAFIQWLIGLAISYFGVMTFLLEYL